jgi:hypothetical protein
MICTLPLQGRVKKLICPDGHLQMSAMRKLPVASFRHRGSTLAPSGKRQHFNQILIFRILLDSQVETGLLRLGPVPQRGGSRSSRNVGRDAVDAEVPLTSGADADG